MDGRDILLEFLDLLNSAMHVEQLLQVSADFLYQKFHLLNCSLRYGRISYDVIKLSQEQSAARKIIEEQVLDSNSFLLVVNPQKDVLLQGVKGIENMDYSLLAFPIRHNNKAGGVCVFYSNENLSEQVELVSLFLSKLSIAVSRARYFEDAKHSAITDSLTGLYNKAYFAEALKNEVARGQRSQRPISLIILDFDNFKDYNDTKGHLEGDALLKAAGAAVRENIRAVDIPSRYGGEEFTIILPETSHDAAFLAAERLRKKIEQEGKTTISLGVVTCMNSSVSPDNLLKEADRALYKAKKLGKNRTVNFIIVDKSIGAIDVQDATSKV